MMFASAEAAWHWVDVGARESLAMIWMTWWPLILGFTLAGFVQSAGSRETLRVRLGHDSPSSLARASMLGALSSSCSYAASAMTRALFSRGASWTNSVVFMVASTNLVIELGVVLYLVLGWQFLVAEFVGGAVMIVLLAIFTRVVFTARRVDALHARLDSSEAPTHVSPSSSAHMANRERVARASRYTMGDLTMIRVELVAGFLVAGFLSAHVPASWWSHVFLSGHGGWTLLEDVLLAPIVAVLACVCSVGNIPLAATLWAHGVAFGGVIAFIFADLIALPLLAIYRRFYGVGTSWRLFALLWGTMSAAGLVVDVLFRVSGLVPQSRHVRILSGHFPLGATLALNIVATIVLLATWWVAKFSPPSASLATDPICGMSVDTSSAAASVQRGSTTFYFCSPRCRDRFLDGGTDEPTHHAPASFIDPVCGMTVEPSTSEVPVERDGVAYYFCSTRCRTVFVDAASPDQPLESGHLHVDE